MAGLVLAAVSRAGSMRIPMRANRRQKHCPSWTGTSWSFTGRARDALAIIATKLPPVKT
jgi:hypothetical protein